MRYQLFVYGVELVQFTVVVLQPVPLYHACFQQRCGRICIKLQQFYITIVISEVHTAVEAGHILLPRPFYKIGIFARYKKLIPQIILYHMVYHRHTFIKNICRSGLYLIYLCGGKLICCRFVVIRFIFIEKKPLLLYFFFPVLSWRYDMSLHDDDFIPLHLLRVPILQSHLILYPLRLPLAKMTGCLFQMPTPVQTHLY